VDAQPLLEDVLSASEGVDAEIAQVVRQIAWVTCQLALVVGDGAIQGALSEVVEEPGHGDAQTRLDLAANRLFLDALQEAPVAAFASEENETAVTLNEGEPFAVAVDPLDGSSNIDTNAPIGTIFAIRPMAGGGNGSAAAPFLRPGTEQLAAGFVIYGPKTCLVLTLGQGTQIFTLDRRAERFVLTCPAVRIPERRREYAINASNYRHWDIAIQTYVDDLVAGVAGPRGADFNMRWIASLVAEAFRILNRGGVFLDPADRRPGYGAGRLRLLYEAHPLAMVIEQAGGGAIDGFTRILDVVPRDLHQRTPLIFGSADKVARVGGYYVDPPSTSERSPLFGRRGLFYHPHR
jgi:fructose-1,6-bisphosphatase I